MMNKRKWTPARRQKWMRTMAAKKALSMGTIHPPSLPPVPTNEPTKNMDMEVAPGVTFKFGCREITINLTTKTDL